MGYIAALLSKTGDDTSSTLIEMLEAASPIRGDAYGIASHEGAMITGSPKNLLKLETEASLGHKLIKIAPNDPPQPIMQHTYPMVFEGRIWHDEGPFNLSTIADLIDANPSHGIRRLIQVREGSYAVTAIEGKRILCGRDVVGVVPIYYGENASLAGVASNRRMLWIIGLNAKPVLPGHIAEITAHGVSIILVRELCQPPVKKASMNESVERLNRLLHKAVETRCRGFSRIALGFSGGIDSSLLAYYLERAGAGVEPICVGLEGSKDFRDAELGADSLGLPLRLISFTNEEVDEDLDDVLWSVEEPDPMKVGVALPLHWAAKIAANSGCRVFFSGSGSDELFGGYHRYIREYAESSEALRESLFRDVANSHEVNYERDYKTCSDLGLELRLPFADIDVIDFGLSLSLELKLSGDLKSPRKLVLRALAIKLGFPKRMAYVRKRAVQYSTGVNKALKMLARRSGKTLSGYLAERFERVKEERLRDRC